MQSTELDKLPDILTARLIADYLSLSRGTVYELFKTKEEYGGIPNFSIGATKRVRKEDLINWINKQVEVKSVARRG